MEFGALYHAPKVLDLDSHTQGFHSKICSVIPKGEGVLWVRNTQWKGLDEGSITGYLGHWRRWRWTPASTFTPSFQPHVQDRKMVSGISFCSVSLEPVSLTVWPSMARGSRQSSPKVTFIPFLFPWDESYFILFLHVFRTRSFAPRHEALVGSWHV